MNSTFFLAKEKRTPQWRVIDAKGKVVGRLATEIADILRGKNTPLYTPHTDAGDYVVVINAEKVVFTGAKMKDKTYEWHTGYIGSLKSLTAKQMMVKNPTHIIEHAVKGMLPKNKLAAKQLTKLKVYAGAQHPHSAQVTTTENKEKNK
jgi:large subunit ribosomal protein L13